MTRFNSISAVLNQPPERLELKENFEKNPNKTKWSQQLTLSLWSSGTDTTQYWAVPAEATSVLAGLPPTATALLRGHCPGVQPGTRVPTAEAN